MVTKQTITYTQHGRKSLQMDLYEGDQYQENLHRRVIIDIHNGHFTSGHRSEELHQVACRHLASKGYLSISMDYRQGLQGRLAFRADTILHAIEMGVEDVLEATAYLLEHAEEYRIDPRQIYLSGAGMGACIALTAEYELCRKNRRSWTETLSQDFNYAGIMANSGAMACGERAFVWAERPCPMVIVQGEGMDDIPRGHFYVPGLLWVGGRALHDELRRAGARTIFLDTSGLEHTVFQNGRLIEEKIRTYLDSMVLANIEMLTT